tara:strand:+ start:146 stop:841 length:696 start_codon:yes stop_codon:yes gene_type:complete
MEVCPVGFFCFDKTTIILIVISLIMIVSYNIGTNNNKLNLLSEKINDYSSKLMNKVSKLKLENKNMTSQLLNIEHKRDHIHANQLAQTELNTQRVHNPLYPPLKTNTFFTHNHPSHSHQHGIPINIRTRGEPTGYQQIGALVENTGDTNKKLLSLFGQETWAGSNKWNYYAVSDGYQGVKVPISIDNRNCMDEYGCRDIRSDDDIPIVGYQNTFKANVYKNDAPKYIPYIY